MTSEEIYYTIALTRMTGFNQQMALQLYQALGSGKAVYDHRHDIGDVMPDATPRLREAMKNCKALENLRDKRKNAWRKENYKAEENEIDDIVTSKWN